MYDFDHRWKRKHVESSHEQAGATVVPALTAQVDLVLGIKEPPVSKVKELLELEMGKKRNWMVFSHTHKGQVSHRLCTLLEGEEGLRCTDATDVQHAFALDFYGQAQIADIDRL